MFWVSLDKQKWDHWPRHPQIFLYHTAVQRNWGDFYFLGSAWEKEHRIIPLSKFTKYTWGGGCFHLLDLASKYRKWEEGIYLALFQESTRELRTMFPFSSPHHSPVWLFFMQSVGYHQTWLLFILYLSKKCCVVLDVLIQKLKI